MNSVLVTGASGALGSALVPLFAADEHSRVVLLMRADSPAHLAQRQEQLMRYLRGLGLDQASERRIEVLRGDISETNLGLATADVQRLARQTTHMVHAAGNVKLNQSLEAARKTAVGSARAVAEFARQCQDSGQFAKLEFVSTVGVAGRRTGLIAETPVTGNRDGDDFHNTYEAAKWEAEKYLGGQIARGLPVTIHRPSMIVGDSRSGRIIHFQVFYHLTEFLLGRRTRGLVPATGDTALDIIPVDYVAKAIHLSATEQPGEGQVRHLCSGPRQAVRLTDLVDQLQLMLQARGEPLPTLRRVPLGMFRALLKCGTPLASARSRPFLAGLPFLLDYLGESQFFDNQVTDTVLRNHALSIPPVQSYLETIMQAYWDRKRAPS